MSEGERYLTKSKFVLARDCPTKLFYNEKDEYLNKKEENQFLEALAKGGMQVGELAKLFYPDGIEIEAKGNTEALAETFKHLQKEQVVLFEPAITYENFLVRADILEKDGTDVRLIEVKSKSYEPDESFLTQNGTVY